MTNYAAGWNMGGYSPDPDNVMVTDSFESAVTYLADTVEYWWDQDCEIADSGDARLRIDGRYLDAHTALHNVGSVPTEVSVVVQDANGYDHYLWITETEEDLDND